MMKTAVFILVLMISGSLIANEKRTIYDFEYGIFSRGAENFEEGDKSISSGSELEKTTTIKAKLGTKFGVRYWLSRAGFIDEPTLHLIYHVPTMINPSTGEYIDKIEILQKLLNWITGTQWPLSLPISMSWYLGNIASMFFLKTKNYWKKHFR